MIRKKNANIHTIEDVVCLNSGMNPDELLHDKKEYHIEGLTNAASMIIDAVLGGKTIYIPADYDVDGIAAAVIMDMTLQCIGANTVVRTPRRFTEGYGLKTAMIDDFEADQLILTVDNGITAFEAIEEAKAKGMTVIVTDHHLAAIDETTGQRMYPAADLIINPNAVPNSADFNAYCGAGLAYRLSLEILGKDHPLVPKLLSLAAIATIADAVPVTFENRRIVKQGLEAMKTKVGTTMGLFALLCVLEVEINTSTIGYKIAPVINAPGRLYDNGAMKAYELLSFEGPIDIAHQMAEDLVNDNKVRRRLSDEWTQKAKEQVENRKEVEIPIVEYLPGIHQGIIGIVAGRIAEEYRIPCIIFGDTTDPMVMKGSGRTYGDVHLKQLLDSNQGLMVAYGGHEAAAGLTVQKKDFECLKVALMESLQLQPRVFENTILYDLKCNPQEIPDILEEVKKYEPFGNGNPAPILLLEDLTLTPKGSGHYKIFNEGAGIRLYSANLVAINFSGAQVYEELNKPRHVNLIGVISSNSYKGRKSNQFEYHYLWPQEKVVNQPTFARILQDKANERYIS